MTKRYLRSGLKDGISLNRLFLWSTWLLAQSLAALDVTHEALALSVDMLEFPPISRLSACARTLLMIWDSLQMADTNANKEYHHNPFVLLSAVDILLNVREEVEEAGDRVMEELGVPISKLTDHILGTIPGGVEVLKQAEGYDAELQEALGMSLSELSNKSKLPEVRRSPATRQITRSATSSRGWMGVIGDVDGVPVGAIGSVGLSLTGTSGTGNALLLTGVETHQRQGQLLSDAVVDISTSTTSSVATVTAPALAPASAPPTLPTTVSEYVAMGPYPDGQAEYSQALFTDFNTFKLPAGTEHEGFALLADIFHTGWHGVQVSGFRPGETIVVSGAEDVELIATYSAV
ncbi:glutathione-independent formaldehyde dehydrogenase [Moniliophthora roreri]|nr:glutathione-independent formaldehyde dehydrogenase [Moniliophthora roreri]